MLDDHFWRDAQAASAGLGPQLRGAYLGRPAGGPFGRSVALWREAVPTVSVFESCFDLGEGIVSSVVVRPRDKGLADGELFCLGGGAARSGWVTFDVVQARAHGRIESARA